MQLPWRDDLGLRKYKKAYEEISRENNHEGGDYVEVGLAYDEWARARSRHMLRRCFRLNVPVPPPNYSGEEPENSYWDNQSQYTGYRYLSIHGLHELEKAIHEVKSRRFERSARWINLAIAIIGALTGLIGASIGLISVWPD